MFVPIDKHTNKSMGFAFITFMMPEHAVQAFNELDGRIFQGRLLHILPAKPKRNTGNVFEEGLLIFCYSQVYVQLITGFQSKAYQVVSRMSLAL